MHEYDTVNVRTMHFTTNVKYTHNANIVFDEVSSDRKLQCLLMDVTVSNKVGNKTTVPVKLDTGASSNLLPYNMFRKIFPQVSVKELCHLVDNNVCLEAYNNSSIKQLGACPQTVRHGKQLPLCHFFVVLCISVFAVEEMPGLMLTKEAITNRHFSKIFSGIGWFPIEPVSFVLSDDAEPVQKLAHKVPVALKTGGKVNRESRNYLKTRPQYSYTLAQ